MKNAVIVVMALLFLVSWSPSNKEKHCSYDGIEFMIPTEWSFEEGVFYNNGEKLGEFVGGLLHPKEQSFNGVQFIEQFHLQGEVEFDGMVYSFRGMPYSIIETNSLKLENTTWYYGITELEFEVDTHFRYTFTCYGPFENSGVILNFYGHSISVLNIKAIKSIIASIKVLE